MRIAQVLVWSDNRPDDHDKVVSEVIPRRVLHKGVRSGRPRPPGRQMGRALARANRIRAAGA